MKRTPGHRGEEIPPSLARANALWAADRRDEALALYEKTLKEHPRSIRAHVDAARAYGRCLRLDRVEPIVERMRGLDPTGPGVHHFAGEIYDRLNLNRKAVGCYEKAAASPHAKPATWLALAELYERRHRLDEARDLTDRALAVRSDLPKARLVLARLDRRDGQEQRAEETLRGLIASLPAGMELASRAWADLALLLDWRGDYDGAMDAIEACKRPLRSRSVAVWQASERSRRRFATLIETVSADDLRRWCDERAGRTDARPDARTAVLTGFPRSGTTLLEQVLDAHPDVVSSEERDVLPEIFKTLPGANDEAASALDVIDALSADRVRAERRRYLDVMERFLGEGVGGRVHLDKNPAMNTFIPVMLRLFPETRLLVALRDPRDVVVSCYLRYLPVNPVSVRFLSLRRTAEQYAFDMASWLTLRDIIDVPSGVVRYEDAVEDLAREARRMLEVLGVPWDDAVLGYRERLESKHVASPTYEAVAQPVHARAIGRWKHYERHLEPVLETLAPFVEAFGYA